MRASSETLWFCGVGVRFNLKLDFEYSGLEVGCVLHHDDVSYF